jgi:hypothetical protein
MLAGCATPAPEPVVGNAPPADGLGSIDGFVVDDAFRPIAGAIVAIPSLELQAITNENSEFAFTNLPPGLYILTITADGHDATPHRERVTADETTQTTLIARQVFSTGEFYFEEEFVMYVDCEIHAATTIECSPTASDKGLELEYAAEAPTYIVIDAAFSNAGNHQIRVTQDNLVASAQFNDTEGSIILQHLATSTSAAFGENTKFNANKAFQLNWQPVGTQGGEGFDGIGTTVATKADISVTILTAGLDPSDYCNSC